MSDPRCCCGGGYVEPPCASGVPAGCLDITFSGITPQQNELCPISDQSPYNSFYFGHPFLGGVNGTWRLTTVAVSGNVLPGTDCDRGYVQLAVLVDGGSDYACIVDSGRANSPFSIWGMGMTVAASLGCRDDRITLRSVTAVVGNGPVGSCPDDPFADMVAGGYIFRWQRGAAGAPFIGSGVTVSNEDDSCVCDGSAFGAYSLAFAGSAHVSFTTGPCVSPPAQYAVAVACDDPGDTISVDLGTNTDGKPRFLSGGTLYYLTTDATTDTPAIGTWVDTECPSMMLMAAGSETRPVARGEKPVASLGRRALAYVRSEASGRYATARTVTLRQLSCFGDPSLGMAPCPSLRGEPGSRWCGACGCGERKRARLDPDDQGRSKLQFTYLECPRRRPGFSNADGGESPLPVIGPA